MKRGIFITGTDTGVGKTYVTALILAELRQRGVKAAAFKPIACGEGGRHDAEIYAKIMDDEEPLDVINPIYLKHPFAPSVAAKLERKRIDLRKVFATYKLLAAKYDVVLVEGAGGLLVPIKHGYFVADLAKDLRLPVVIIARPGLGTINHTLLTVRQARAMGLKVAGIVLNDTTGKRGLAEKTNVVEIPKLTGVPVLGVVSYRGKDVKVICKNLTLL
jgi:dethiobiotin synthetase